MKWVNVVPVLPFPSACWSWSWSLGVLAQPRPSSAGPDWRDVAAPHTSVHQEKQKHRYTHYLQIYIYYLLIKTTSLSPLLYFDVFHLKSKNEQILFTPCHAAIGNTLLPSSGFIGACNLVYGPTGHQRGANCCLETFHSTFLRYLLFL